MKDSLTPAGRFARELHKFCMDCLNHEENTLLDIQAIATSSERTLLTIGAGAEERALAIQLGDWLKDLPGKPGFTPGDDNVLRADLDNSALEGLTRKLSEVRASMQPSSCCAVASCYCGMTAGQAVGC